MKVAACVFAVCLVTFCMVSPSLAGCSLSNLQGSWTAYLDFGGAWLYCDLVIKAKGVVGTGTTCTDYTGAKWAIKGGSLKITQACTITGQIKVNSTAAGDVTVTVDRGTLAIDKQSAALVGHNSVEQYFSMEAVKK